MYKRILLKLTGELFGSTGEALDSHKIRTVAQYIAYLKENYQIDLAIVVGGGNLFRGRNVSEGGFDRAQADFIGMLGTIMNGLALQGELNLLKIESRVMTSLPVDQACEPYIRLRAKRHMEKGRTIILVGGTGRPFFTTDTTAALLAVELDCEVLLKGSNVDGIYSDDPKINPDAEKYSSLTFQVALEKGLMVMDDTAFAVCKKNKIPVIVFDISDLDNIERIILGENIGTIVT